jgi:hypothetical protein
MNPFWELLGRTDGRVSEGHAAGRVARKDDAPGYLRAISSPPVTP